MKIKNPGCGFLEYSKTNLESPEIHGFKSLISGLSVRPWICGPYNNILKILKLR